METNLFPGNTDHSREAKSERLSIHCQEIVIIRKYGLEYNGLIRTVISIVCFFVCLSVCFFRCDRLFVSLFVQFIFYVFFWLLQNLQNICTKFFKRVLYFALTRKSLFFPHVLMQLSIHTLENKVKNPNWQEANQLKIWKGG